MKKYEREVQQAFLHNEEAVIKRLKQVYNQSLKDVTSKAQELQNQIFGLQQALDTVEDAAERAQLQSMIQSKVYQKQYQDALKTQINSILDNMQVEEFKTVSDYLTKCYDEGFMGAMYSLQQQGIPLILPIDQTAVVRAVQLDSKISKGLYSRLGEDVALLKKKITAQVSRGISTGMSFAQVAKQLEGYTNIGYNNAVRIARTEGHRIQIQSADNACREAKAKGADVVRQWDAALDGRTRPSHRMVDGEIRELDEPFSNGLKFPGDPAGGAAEVVNCRCALLQRAKWALDEAELETLKERAEYFGLDKSENFEDFKKKYLKAVEMQKTVANVDSVTAATKGVNSKTVDEVNQAGTQTLADAYEHHRIKNGLSSVPYSELGEGSSIIQANYGKMSVESATAFNDMLQSLISEYDTPLQKVRTMTKDEFFGNRSSFAFVSHDYTVDSAELVINPTKCKDISALADRIKELSEDGYCVKIPDEYAEKYVITHEFAHTLINLEQPLKDKTNWLNADYGKIKAARKEIKAVHKSYMLEVERLTQSKDEAELLALTEITDEHWEAANKAIDALEAVKLSDYSLESADEFMAESFANEKIGVASNKYSKQILDILDKYFKR